MLNEFVASMHYGFNELFFWHDIEVNQLSNYHQLCTVHGIKNRNSLISLYVFTGLNIYSRIIKQR